MSGTHHNLKSLPTIVPDNIKVAGGAQANDPSVAASMASKSSSDTSSAKNYVASTSTAKKTLAKKTTQRKRWKKPADKPKRPLSAYNLFFQDERKRIISEMEASGVDASRKEESASEGGDEPRSADGKRRPHRRTSGVGFKQLAQTIGQKWKVLDSATRAPYEKQAAKEKEKYKIALVVWKEKHEKKEKDAIEAAKIASEQNHEMQQQQHIQHQSFERRSIAAAPTAASASVVTSPIPGMSSQQLQQYLASFAGISLPILPQTHPSNTPIKNTIDIHNTSLFDQLKLANGMTSMQTITGINDTTRTAAAPSGDNINDNPAPSPSEASAVNPYLQQLQVSPDTSNIKQPSSLQQQQVSISPQATAAAVAVAGLSNSYEGFSPAPQVQHQIPASMPNTTSANAPSGTSIGGPKIGWESIQPSWESMQQVVNQSDAWESIQQVVNQSDASGMAAAAVNAASGRNANGDNEDPIEAISRAQAFLSNLKASLEAGQPPQQSG